MAKLVRMLSTQRCGPNASRTFGFMLMDCQSLELTPLMLRYINYIKCMSITVFVLLNPLLHLSKFVFTWHILFGY